jgi:hypothetical protein
MTFGLFENDGGGSAICLKLCENSGAKTHVKLEMHAEIPLKKGDKSHFTTKFIAKLITLHNVPEVYSESI